MQSRKITMSDVFENPNYLGKHIILVKGKLYTALNGKQAAKILRKVRLEYPNSIPQITYLPKANSLIL